MSTIEWKDKYNTGNEMIDSQHRHFIDLINLVDQKQNISKNELIKVFIELENYAKFHFQEEEKLMNNIGMDRFIRHKEEHDFFIDKLKNIEKEIETEDPNLISNLSYFLSNWLISHILNIDKEFAQYLLKEEIIELNL